MISLVLVLEHSKAGSWLTFLICITISSNSCVILGHFIVSVSSRLRHIHVGHIALHCNAHNTSKPRSFSAIPGQKQRCRSLLEQSISPSIASVTYRLTVKVMSKVDFFSVLDLFVTLKLSERVIVDRRSLLLLTSLENYPRASVESEKQDKDERKVDLWQV